MIEIPDSMKAELTAKDATIAEYYSLINMLITKIETQQAELAELRALVTDGITIIEAGAALMTVDQLREWAGHGAWLHVAGFKVEEVEAAKP